MKQTLLFIGAIGLSLAGCTTLDTTDLDRARAVVDNAKRNPRIPADRSVDLQEAERQIDLADHAVANGEEQEIVSHHAYLAEAHARTALAIAATQGARAEAEALEALYTETAAAHLADARSEASRAWQGAGEAERRARALQAEQTGRGLVLTLGGVLFRLASADLESPAQIALARLAGFLIALPQRGVVIEGHTDDAGSRSFNLGLSKQRAAAVQDFLVANGVEPDRIVTDGYGMAYPVAPNDSEEGREKNRRVEIIILEPGEPPAQGRRQMRDTPNRGG